jgi:hypothetical protein
MKEDLISIEKKEDGRLILRVKSGKRKKLYFRIIPVVPPFSTCDPLYCPIYYTSQRMKSPYKRSKFRNFCEFCNKVGIEFPQLLGMVGGISKIIPDERYKDRVGKEE